MKFEDLEIQAITSDLKYTEQRIAKLKLEGKGIDPELEQLPDQMKQKLEDKKQAFQTRQENGRLKIMLQDALAVATIASNDNLAKAAYYKYLNICNKLFKKIYNEELKQLGGE